MVASVTVGGSASMTIRPDRAVLGLSLTHLAKQAGDALAHVATRSATLEALLATLGLDPSDWTTGGVTVGPEYEWRKDQNVLTGQRATTWTTVRVRSLEVIGSLITQATSDVDAQVSGPTWRVDDDNPARLELYAEAARDARRRAAAYAAALGLQLGDVEAVSEFAIEGGGSAGAPMAKMAMMSRGGGPAQDIAVNPGEIEVTASVNVRFTLLPA
jgi:uncharacterized protein YggE